MIDGEIFELMKKFNSKIICFYSKNKFNEKLNCYQKKILTLLKKIKLNDHEKFLRENPQYSIEELKRRLFTKYYSEIELFLKKKADELALHKKKNR